jgi:ketosteroid isomerase-like protein
MSIEQNKQAVRDWFVALEHADEQAVLDMTTEDFRFKCMSRQPEWLRLDWGREEFAAAPKSMATSMAEPVRIWIVDMTAEGDRVAVEAAGDGKMLNGKRYDNAYHFVFKFRDGKCYECLEYSCSHLAQSCFGGDPVEAQKAGATA